MNHHFHYLIIGGGLAGASAIEGIRQQDKAGSIGLLCAEGRLPYHRPPLSKELLLGKRAFDQIFVFDRNHYKQREVELHLKTTVKSIDVEGRFVVDDKGARYGYSKLLIATGGCPREFVNSGTNVHYYRNAEDYLALEKAIGHVNDFLVIGGGFIGAELSAGLCQLGKKVIVLLKGKYLLEQILPSDLASFVTDLYIQKGVTFVTGDGPAGFEVHNDRVMVTTQGAKELEADWVIAGIGMDPETELARSAGLRIDKGILVNRYLQTSRPGIYAAGDLALFPCQALDENIRFEHWDNAKAQGKCAGINMAGGDEPYVYLPYFYSDLFDLGFEAVGKLDARMRTLSAWEEPFRKGVVVYLGDQKVKGVLLWNQPKMLDWARKLITEQASPDDVSDLRRLLPVLSVA